MTPALAVVCLKRGKRVSNSRNVNRTINPIGRCTKSGCSRPKNNPNSEAVLMVALGKLSFGSLAYGSRKYSLYWVRGQFSADQLLVQTQKWISQPIRVNAH